MSKSINLIGQKFGKWTILERAENSAGRDSRWLCRCECGTEKIVYGKNLRNGRSTSCGCYKKSNLSKLKRLDLTGQRFGRLTALEIAKDENGEEIKNNSGLLWRCKCDCGNEVFVPTTVLR